MVFVNESAEIVWGLTPRQRLERALTRAAVAGDMPDSPGLVFRADAIFDEALVKALLQQPGKVLTSMLKRVDVAVYNAFDDVKNDKFVADIQNLGLKEDGVGAAMDDNNKPLMTPEMVAAVDKAKADIISGAVQVHDYMSDEKCPY